MIGSSNQSHTLENPFTAGERISMIRLALNEEGISTSSYCIIPVYDLNIHALWVSHVYSMVPKFDVVYSNEPLTRRLFLEAGFQVKSISFYMRDKLSATNIREKMFKNGNWRDLIPSSVSKYIIDIDGLNRIKDLVRYDILPDKSVTTF
jgi:nicotinamide-nucleotide adenylyltransferase